MCNRKYCLHWLMIEVRMMCNGDNCLHWLKLFCLWTYVQLYFENIFPDNSLFGNDIIVPIHLQSSLHWILAIIVSDTCELMLIDSYPTKTTMKQHKFCSNGNKTLTLHEICHSIQHRGLLSLQTPFPLIALSNTTPPAAEFLWH